MPITKSLKDYSDVHYTTQEVAKSPCLEPCRGAEVIYDALPEGSDWCEIEEGRDFFAYGKQVAWIVTNPPFSNMTEWMIHSFCLAENVVFLIPLSKLFSSAPRMKVLRDYGGIKTILYLGTGRSIGFNIGFPFGAVHFQRDWEGGIEFLWFEHNDDEDYYPLF